MRWTTKTNNLLEQYKNINVEEYKRMTEEKKLFQQQIATLKAENQRTKIQLETLKTNAASTTDELATLKVGNIFYCSSCRTAESEHVH